MNENADNILTVRNVSKRFGGLIAVNKVSFDVKRNEILGLIGPNGAGKTTLFTLLSGFQTPDSGEILFEGTKIIGKRPHEICHLGLTRTFQLIQLFTDMKVLDNVTIGALGVTNSIYEARELAFQTLELTGLAEKAETISRGLTLADQKRLEIAKALATQPKLILLDEVMSGLTPRECNEAVELVQKIRDTGVTLIVIEHVMKALMTLANRIIVMHYGEKLADGLPKEIVNDPIVIEAYLGGE